MRGIAEYLGSGLIRGIGPRLAAKIAEKFGEDTFDILMHEPERLSELRGITDRKAKEIGRQFTEQSEMRLLMDFLSEHGLRSRSRRCCTSACTTAPSTRCARTRICCVTHTMMWISSWRTVWRWSLGCRC